MAILEKIAFKRAVNGSTASGMDPSLVAEPCSRLNTDNPEPAAVASVQMKVAIVDAVADLQSIKKPDEIKTFRHLADHFITHVLKKYSDTDEVRIIFDRYDVPSSLKMATRARRQAGQHPVAYHITDTTNKGKVPMKRLLSHVNTKTELTSYLSLKMMNSAQAIGKRIVVAWASQCKATYKDMSLLQSNQEEADTKLLLHALDATASGATRIRIHLPDTDVFVLSLRRYPELCEDTAFVNGVANRHRVIPLQTIVEVPGPERTQPC